VEGAEADSSPAFSSLSVLVDTSIWVHHLSRGNSELAQLLETEDVLCHPFVIGELACGSMRNREEVLGLLATLPQTLVADHDELVNLVQKHHLYGLGLGWIDVHLLGSGLLSSCKLWTLDKALGETARRLGIAVSAGKIAG
jgi:predicted nucleic acid-binding protein